MSYRCSYCGKEGHNRRTCPELSVTGTDVTSHPRYHSQDFKPGDIIGAIPDGDYAPTWEYRPDDKSAHGRRIVVVEHVLSERIVRCRYLFPNREFTTDINSPQYCDVQFTDRFVRVEIPWDYLTPPKSKKSAKGKEITQWEIVDKVIPNSRITLLFGPPGTGKTTAGNFAGNPDKVYNITLTEETPAAELRGHFVPKGGEFVWMDGPALSAYRNGNRLVLNEIDKASGDAMTFCHALLDDPGISAITLPTGETVKPHDGFSVVATTNGEPDDLPEALRDRFSVSVFVPKPHPLAIASLPEDLRGAAEKSSEGDSPVTFRNWKAFANLRDSVGEEIAALSVFGDRSQVILDTLKISRVGLFKS